MITLNVETLVAAVNETDSFALPEMTVGAKYLYDNIYGKLAQNMEVRLSAINFAGFELDDIDFIRELHFSLESYDYRARAIMDSLQKLPPATVTAPFV